MPRCFDTKILNNCSCHCEFYVNSSMLIRPSTGNLNYVADVNVCFSKDAFVSYIAQIT